MEKKQIWTVVGIALVIVIVGFVYTNMTGEMVGEEEKLIVYGGAFNTVDLNGKVYEISADIDYERGIVNLEVSRLGESFGEKKAVRNQEVVFDGGESQIHISVANIKKSWNRKPYVVLRVSEDK